MHDLMFYIVFTNTNAHQLYSSVYMQRWVNKSIFKKFIVIFAPFSGKIKLLGVNQ